MERPGSRRVRRAAPAALLVGLVALWVLRASFGAPASGATHHLGTVLDGLAALVAAGFCARAASRARNPRARIAWLAQCASCLVWTLAPVTWLVAPGDDVAWLSPADAGRAGYLLFAAVGFWLTARGEDIRARLRLVLDGAVGALSGLIVVWAVVMTPILDTAHRTAPEIALTMVYPVGALVGLIFYAFLGVTEFRPGRRRMPFLFVLGLINICVADLSFARLSFADGAPATAVGSGGWFVGFLLVASAAGVYRGTTVRQTLPPTTWWLTYTPYLMLVPAIATPAIQVATGHHVPATETGAGGLIIAVILGRQLLILAENRTLVERLLASEQSLRRQALHDHLTGLGNRALLLSRLTETLEARSGELTLLFCDLDDFKQVNDTLGHHAGDLLLVQVADRLRTTLRAEDTIVRIGGDEYAAMMICPPADARAVADRLWQLFQQPYPVLGHRLRLSASIGLTHVDGSAGLDADEVLREADDAMYAVKRAGKNGVQVFGPDLPSHWAPPPVAPGVEDPVEPGHWAVRGADLLGGPPAGS